MTAGDLFPWSREVSDGVLFVGDGPIQDGLFDPYRLANCVPGSWNRRARYIAHFAALRPDSAPGTIHFCGGPGLGKRHIARAIAREWGATGRRVLVMKTTAFVALVEKTRHGHSLPSGILDWFGGFDAVIFETLDFLTVRPGYNEHWVQVFDELMAEKRRVVVTSASPVSAFGCPIFTLEPIFRRGPVVEFRCPGRADRRVILSEFCRSHRLRVPSAAVFEASREGYRTVAELEAAVVRLAQLRSAGSALTAEDAVKVLGEWEE